MRWKISTNTVDGFKSDTKCAHSVHGRPTLKDEERFHNGLVRKPYERSLYKRTVMSEKYIQKKKFMFNCRSRLTKPEFLPNIKPE